MPAFVSNFSKDYDIDKFRPGLLQEWNFEMVKIDPEAMAKL
jgi:hypothetical protein